MWLGNSNLPDPGTFDIDKERLDMIAKINPGILTDNNVIRQRYLTLYMPWYQRLAIAWSLVWRGRAKFPEVTIGGKS